jgi:hypothetical protein
MLKDVQLAIIVYKQTGPNVFSLIKQGKTLLFVQINKINHVLKYNNQENFMLQKYMTCVKQYQ